MMGSGSFGVNITKDLPLSKDEYYHLLELLVVYIWLPSKGYQETLQSMTDLPMPPEIRTSLEQRLIDIRNTVVADLKIANAEKLVTLQVPLKDNASKSEEGKKASSVV